MSTSIDWSWAFYTIAGVLACAGVWLGWRALLHDRARGRKRCPKCWYDLTALTGLDEPEAPARESSPAPNAPSELPRCPECGHVARKMKHLSRTRRHWKLALLALVLMMLSVGSGVTPKVRRDGWASLIPLRAFPLLRHLLKPDQFARLEPGYQQRVLALGPDAALDAVARDHSLLRTRVRWPKDLHPAVATQSWLGAMFLICDGELAAHRPARTRDADSFRFSWNDGQDAYVSDTPGFYVVYFNRTSPRANQRFIPFDRSCTLEELITPVSGMDDTVRQALRPVIIAGKRGPHNALIEPVSWKFEQCLYVAEIADPDLAGVTLGMRCEVLDNDKPVAHARWWQRRGAIAIQGAEIKISGDLTAPLADPTNPRYTVRFTGDGEMALRDFDATKYWKGSFTIPFAELIPKR
jgi:hypothetical protein